jgi:mono/diheme cytochrome c family protein
MNRYISSARRIFSLAGLGLAVSACAPNIPSGLWDDAVMIESSPQKQGDVEEGYRALTHNPYVSCGIPYTFFSLMGGGLGPVDGEEWLPNREGLNAELPYMWNASTTKDGVELVTQNCLSCHAGRFNGELVLGLGDVSSDYTVDPAEGTAGMVVPDFMGTAAERAELEKFLHRIQLVGPTITTKTVGTNPAEMMAVTLVAHRDPETLAWSDELLQELPDITVISDPPPWWRSRKKHGLFYNGMARGDHRGTMMLASALCTDTVEEAREIDSYFHHIQAFIESIDPPAYPFDIDKQKANKGERVFIKSCAGCHGTHGKTEEDDTYPNLLFSLEQIGTDPVVAEAGTVWAPHMVEWYNESFYGEITKMTPNDPYPGYVAPPLDGIWATAPFFHNGSVPTIEGVLNSSLRPTYWKRASFDTTDFDPQALGWPVESLEYGQEQADEEERRYIYDTTLFSHGNGGHPFGDMLTDTERSEVLEYLKTL